MTYTVAHAHIKLPNVVFVYHHRFVWKWYKICWNNFMFLEYNDPNGYSKMHVCTSIVEGFRRWCCWWIGLVGLTIKLISVHMALRVWSGEDRVILGIVLHLLHISMHRNALHTDEYLFNVFITWTYLMLLPNPKQVYNEIYTRTHVLYVMTLVRLAISPYPYYVFECKQWVFMLYGGCQPVFL